VEAQGTIRSSHDERLTGAASGSKETAAYDIFALLAKELPKLVDSSTGGGAPPIERRNKRRCVDLEDVATPTVLRTDDSPTLLGQPLLDEIVTAYFAHVHPWIPMIHQGTFLRRYAAHTEQRQILVILHAMIIATSKFVPDAQELSHTLICARTWVVSTAMDCISLENLQALIIIAFDDIGNGDTRKACRSSDH